MVWVECVPCSPKDMFNLPPNLPLYDLHWKGRKMPGADRAFDSAEQAARLIHFHRNASGLVTDDSRMAGPLPKQNLPDPTKPTTPTMPEHKIELSPFRLGSHASKQVPSVSTPVPAPAPIPAPSSAPAPALTPIPTHHRQVPFPFTAPAKPTASSMGHGNNTSEAQHIFNELDKLKKRLALLQSAPAGISPI